MNRAFVALRSVMQSMMDWDTEKRVEKVSVRWQDIKDNDLSFRSSVEIDTVYTQFWLSYGQHFFFTKEVECIWNRYVSLMRLNGERQSVTFGNESDVEAIGWGGQN